MNIRAKNIDKIIVFLIIALFVILVVYMMIDIWDEIKNPLVVGTILAVLAIIETRNKRLAHWLAVGCLILWFAWAIFA